MGENHSAIEQKKEKLKREYGKEKPNKHAIERLKRSIKRHKEIEKRIRYQRLKQRKKNK